MTRKKKQQELALTCPNTRMVFGRTYQINYEAAGGLGQTCIGSTDNLNQIITVDSSQTPIEEADTVLHEVLHTIAWTMKIGMDRETEERVVSAFASGLLWVIQDNPQFGIWLVDDKSRGIF